MRKIIHKSKAFKTAANLPSKFTQRSEKRKKNSKRSVSEILQATVIMLNVKVREKTIKNRPNKYGLFNKEKKIKSDSMVQVWKVASEQNLEGVMIQARFAAIESNMNSFVQQITLESTVRPCV